MECTWLIYVNVIDCAEVMMNSFCSTCYLFVCFSLFFIVYCCVYLTLLSAIFIFSQPEKNAKGVIAISVCEREAEC